jgi:hypothetical protein
MELEDRRNEEEMKPRDFRKQQLSWAGVAERARCPQLKLMLLFLASRSSSLSFISL